MTLIYPFIDQRLSGHQWQRSNRTIKQLLFALFLAIGCLWVQGDAQTLDAPKIYFSFEGEPHPYRSGFSSVVPGEITNLEAKPDGQSGTYTWSDRFWVSGAPGSDSDVFSAIVFDPTSGQGTKTMIINDQLNDATSFFGINSDTGHDVEAFTISCWIHVDPSQTTRRYILYGEDASGNLGIGLSLEGEHLYLIKYVNNATAPKGDALGSAVVGDSWEGTFLGPATFTAGAGWYHVVLVQAPYYTRLFVGNPPEKVNDEWQGKVGKFDVDFAGSMVLHGKQDLSSFTKWGLGRPSSDTNKIPVDGIDDFMVFDYAMTEAQAEALYQCQVANEANTCFGIGQSYSQSFAIIGDYGCDGGSFNGLTSGLSDVANMVKGWNPDFILTVGDDSYHDSAHHGCDTDIDENIGKYYRDYIYPYTSNNGYTRTPGSPTTNRFFPVMGNHDDNCLSGESDNGAYNCSGRWENYFSGLPNNKRYYKFTQGNVDFFAINSNKEEPDSNKYRLANGNLSTQAQWIKNELESSTATFKVVFMHHAPYSSYNASDESKRGSNREMLKWPLKEWGADIVISGDDHYYERNDYRNMTYVINGAGGMPTLANIDSDRIVAGNRVHIDQKFGAIKVDANDEVMRFQFHSIDPANRSNIQLEDEFYLFKRSDDATYLVESINDVFQQQEKMREGLTVYPNPTSGRLQVRLTNETEGTGRFNIYSVSGKRVYRTQQELIAGAQEVDLGNVRSAGLTPGIYFLEVIFGSQLEIVKIVVN